MGQSLPLPPGFRWKPIDLAEPSGDLVLHLDGYPAMPVAHVRQGDRAWWVATVNVHLDWCYQATRVTPSRAPAVAYVAQWLEARGSDVRCQILAAERRRQRLHAPDLPWMLREASGDSAPS